MFSFSPKDAISLLEYNKKIISSWEKSIDNCPMFLESKDRNDEGKRVLAEEYVLSNVAILTKELAMKVNCSKKENKVDPDSKTRVKAETLEEVLSSIFELATAGKIQSEHIIPKDKINDIQLTLSEMGFDIFASYDGRLDVIWNRPNARPLTRKVGRCQVFYFTDDKGNIFEG